MVFTSPKNNTLATTLKVLPEKSTWKHKLPQYSHFLTRDKQPAMQDDLLASTAVCFQVFWLKE